METRWTWFQALKLETMLKSSFTVILLRYFTPWNILFSVNDISLLFQTCCLYSIQFFEIDSNIIDFFFVCFHYLLINARVWNNKEKSLWWLCSNISPSQWFFLLFQTWNTVLEECLGHLNIFLLKIPSE